MIVGARWGGLSISGPADLRGFSRTTGAPRAEEEGGTETGPRRRAAELGVPEAVPAQGGRRLLPPAGRGAGNRVRARGDAAPVSSHAISTTPSEEPRLCCRIEALRFK